MCNVALVIQVPAPVRAAEVCYDREGFERTNVASSTSRCAPPAAECKAMYATVSGQGFFQSTALESNTSAPQRMTFSVWPCCHNLKKRRKVSCKSLGLGKK
jgi:hypothetical protein